MGDPSEKIKKRIRRSDSEKEVIAYNIHTLRVEKYPGHGGVGQCAAAYKADLTQWSTWETGRRSPDEDRLASIAKFFKVTVEDLKKVPENWHEVREQWLASKRTRKSKSDMSTPTPQHSVGRSDGMPGLGSADVGSGGEESPISKEQANKDYVEALQLLLDGQERYGQGKIRSDKYSKVMRSIISLVKYGLAD